MARHCAAMVAFADRGAEVFDYGNSLRREAELGGFERAFAYPGFLPAYIRPLFCEGKGPFRWAALSGDPADIGATDRAVLDEFPDNEALARWIRLASDRVAFQGLPARICWLGYGERDRMGLRFNELVAAGRLQAPIVIGRDHLDSGSVASPYRETEAMRDGSDAIADWPLLNALLNTASGASWVSSSTTAAASASAGRSTPGWWSWPTAPTWRPRSSSGSSPGVPMREGLDPSADDVGNHRQAPAPDRGCVRFPQPEKTVPTRDGVGTGGYRRGCVDTRGRPAWDGALTRRRTYREVFVVRPRLLAAAAAAAVCPSPFAAAAGHGRPGHRPGWPLAAGVRRTPTPSARL